MSSSGQVSWPGLSRKQGQDEGLLGGVIREQEGSRTGRGGGAELRAGCGGPRAAGLRRGQASQNRASVREEKEAGTDLRGRGGQLSSTSGLSTRGGLRAGAGLARATGRRPPGHGEASWAVPARTAQGTAGRGSQRGGGPCTFTRAGWACPRRQARAPTRVQDPGRRGKGLGCCGGGGFAGRRGPQKRGEHLVRTRPCDPERVGRDPTQPRKRPSPGCS